jgi:hypothetical protein
MREQIQHGPRRCWYAPWRMVCRCGLGPFPCVAARMLQRPKRVEPAAVVNAWNGPTAFIRTPPGRAGSLTPAQAWRAGGGDR